MPDAAILHLPRPPAAPPAEVERASLRAAIAGVQAVAREARRHRQPVDRQQAAIHRAK